MSTSLRTRPRPPPPPSSGRACSRQRVASPFSRAAAQRQQWSVIARGFAVALAVCILAAIHGSEAKTPRPLGCTLSLELLWGLWRSPRRGPG